MDERFRSALLTAWQSRDGAADINACPATEEELREFEDKFLPNPD